MCFRARKTDKPTVCTLLSLSSHVEYQILSWILDETGDSLVNTVSRQMTVNIRKAINGTAAGLVFFAAPAQNLDAIFSHSLMLSQMWHSSPQQSWPDSIAIYASENITVTSTTNAMVPASSLLYFMPPGAVVR